MIMPHNQVVQKTFSNGMKVIVCSMPYTQTLSLGFFVKVGSRYETPQQWGMSHLIEHLLFKGSKKYSSLEISKILERHGGDFNAYTSEEHTCYYIKTFPECLSTALDVFEDILKNPLFEAEELEKERQVILEEIQGHEDHPGDLIQDLFAKTLFPHSPLGNTILGTAKSLHAFRKEHVEEFFTRYYNSANITIAVAGNIQPERMIEDLERRSDSYPRGFPGVFEKVEETDGTAQVALHFKDCEQVYFEFGMPCPSRFYSKREVLQVLNTILGGNMSSKLYQVLREQQAYAYAVDSSVELYEDIGVFSIEGDIDPKKLVPCVRSICDILTSMYQQPLEQEDIAHAKAYIRGETLQSLEDSLACMLWLGDLCSSGEEDFILQNYLDRIENVSVRDLQELAQELFRDKKPSLACVGPYEDKESLLNVIRGVKYDR